MSTTRHLFRTAALVLFGACVAAGCTSTDQADDPNTFADDNAGDWAHEGEEEIVRIVSVDRSSVNTDGSVRYVLENVTNEDQDTLTARVTFFYPPSGDFDLPYDTDVTEEMDVPLFKGQNDYVLLATSRAFAERAERGEKVLATNVSVSVAEMVPIVARDNVSPGTRLLNGQIECVGISPEDLRLGLDGAEPQLWVEFENVTTRPVRNVQLSVVFLDTQGEEKTGETGWHRMAPVAPGERQKVSLDLSSAGEVAHRPFLVRVRQVSGLIGGGR